MNDKEPTSRELAAAMGQRRSGLIRVAPAEDRTWNGIVFDSKHEMSEWIKFESLEKAGAITELQRQVQFDLHAVTPGGMKVKITSYTADITCKDRAGKLCIYDPKGYRTPRYTLIKKWFEAEYGLRIVEL